MKEKLRIILQNAWNEPRHFFFWLTLFSGTGLAALYFLDRSGLPPHMPPLWFQMAACAVGAILACAILAGGLGFVLSWIPPLRPLFHRMLRRRFFLLACLATLVALFYTVENWRGKRAWERFKRGREAQGEYFELAKLAPPAVPDDQNFAMAPIVMTTYSSFMDRDGRKISSSSNIVKRLEMPIEVIPAAGSGDVDRPRLVAPGIGNWLKGERIDLSAWQSYYRVLAARTNLFPVAPQPQTPAAEVLLALSRYDAVLEELRQAAQRPYSRFPLEYDADNPAAVLLPYLSAIRSCLRPLQLRACAELEAGQSDKALDDVRLMLRLVDAINDQPMLITHLVRIAMVNLALQPVWEGVAGQRWSDEQLSLLEQELGRLDFLASYRLSLRGEQSCIAGVIDCLRRTRDLDLIDSSGDHGLVPAVLIRLSPNGWFRQNQLSCGRRMANWYEPLADLEHRTISPTSVARADKAVAAEIVHRTPYNLIECTLLPALGMACRRFAYAQVNVDLARVACALERYRLAQGDYPQALDALAPRYIAALPRDVINGQPLHYRRVDPKRFMLYSVGWNETDDGGRVVLRKVDGPVDVEKGDWVWRNY
jgi:hypothetical protein